MNIQPIVFSIVTPSYNQSAFLEKTISSILQQDYDNKEFILIDGGSSDGSLAIIEKYRKNIDYWISETDNGQVDAIQKGFSAAKGSVFCWLNSDDRFLPGTLRKVSAVIDKHPDAVAWVGDCRLVDEHGHKLRTVKPRELTREGIADWGRKGWFFQPSCFFSAEAYRTVGGLSDRFHLAFDVELWLKLSELGKFVIINDVLSEATIHGDAKTQKQKNEMLSEHIMIQTMYGFDDLAKERISDLLNQAWLFKTSKLGRLVGNAFNYIARRVQK